MKNYSDKDKVKQKMERDLAKKRGLASMGVGSFGNKAQKQGAQKSAQASDSPYNQSKWYYYRGRINRQQFLAYLTICGGIILTMLALFALTIGLDTLSADSDKTVGFFGGFLVFIMNVVALGTLGIVHSRRLNDLNLSSFYILLLIIPIINLLLTIYLAVKEGEGVSNRFGRPPKPATALQKNVAYAGPVAYMIVLSSLLIFPTIILVEKEPQEIAKQGLVDLNNPSSSLASDQGTFNTSDLTNNAQDLADDFDNDQPQAQSSNGNAANKDKNPKSKDPEILLPMTNEGWQDVSTHTDPAFDNIDGFLEQEKVYVDK